VEESIENFDFLLQ